MESAESVAECVLKSVRLDGHDSPDPSLIAKRLGARVFLAPRSVRFGALGERVRVGDEERIYLRTGLLPSTEAHVLAHEIGHVIVARWNLHPSDEEGWCNRFGAALLAPATSVRRAWRECASIATMCDRWPLVPPTCIALRVGETLCADVFVTQGRRVAFAAARSEATSAIVELGAEAARDGAAARPGLRAVRLSGRVHRAAVVLEDVA